MYFVYRGKTVAVEADAFKMVYTYRVSNRLTEKKVWALRAVTDVDFGLV